MHESGILDTDEHRNWQKSENTLNEQEDLRTGRNMTGKVCSRHGHSLRIVVSIQ